MGLAERGRRVPTSFSAEHGRGTEERDGGHQRLLTERQREMGGGGPVRAAPHGGRRKGVNPVAPHGGEHGGLVGSDAGKGVDTTDATAGQKRGAGWRMWATRWRTWANRGRRDLGRARENSAVLQLIPDFQTEQELIRSKTGFSLIKNL
jgi:hypothetical protein